jgi:hypothetical protein
MWKHESRSNLFTDLPAETDRTALGLRRPAAALPELWWLSVCCFLLVGGADCLWMEMEMKLELVEAGSSNSIEP